MAISSDHLPIDSISEQWTSDHQLLTAQAAIMNQLSQFTRGTLVLDELLHSIALQLHTALQASGCVILQPDGVKPGAVSPVSVVTVEQVRRDVSVEHLYRLSREFCQYYHCQLAQGNPVILSANEQQLPLLRQELVRECNLSSILIVPLLYRQSYLGGVMLCQCENEREWTPQEIAFVQAIADHCAIALSLVELDRETRVSSLPFQGESSKNFTECKAPSFEGGANPKSKIQNPKSIDERYQAEHKEGLQSEFAWRDQKRLQAVFNQTRQFIGFLTPEGIVLDVSKTVLEFAGINEQEIIGHMFWEAPWWVHSLETNRQLQEAIATAASGKLIRYEVNIFGKRDRDSAKAPEELNVVTLDFSLSPLKDETGQVVLLIFEGQDITDYKLAQSVLRASVTRNTALLEAIPNAIFRITRDGIYLNCQAAKADTLPVHTTEIIGKHLHQVLPTEVAGLTWHHIELAFETNETQIIEYQLWLNGKPHNFEARIVKSGLDEAIVIVQDITERVQSQAVLQQVNEALENRVAERTAALKQANHCLKTEIIERKQAEEQLRQSEERFRNLVETTNDWVWEVDENAVYTYTSPRVRSLLGYEILEVLGKTPFDFMPPEECQHVAELFASIAASRQSFTCFENINLHKDGHSIILERSGVPIFDAKGIFRGYRGIDRDITERKRAEKEVQFLHSITQAIFKSQDFHAAIDVALQKVCESIGWDFGEAWVPRPDGSVLECSPAWFSKSKRLESFRSASEKLTFSPGSGLPGRVWVLQQPEWRRDVSAESNQIYLRAEAAKEVGLKAGLGIPLLTPSGVLAVLVFYMFEPKDEDQRLIELISASTELGLMIQRKQAEEDVHKALAREKELTELKSRFISMTSHEFRTPLTTIQSSAELLEHYSRNWTEEKKLTHLHRIQISVKHMTKLLNDILIIGKAEAGKLKLNPAPLDLENFCRDLVEELQLNDTNQHTVTFSYSQKIGERKGLGARDWGLGEENFSSESAQLVEDSSFLVSSPQSLAPAKLSCIDEKLLRQILENLLSNAIKYSLPGSIVEFTLNSFPNHVVFQIRDQGIGIPAEDQKRLFETFHRAANVGTIAGTGLGLAIVKRCVDIHQGQIDIESKVGVGTTFTVTLPTYNSLNP